MFEIVEWKESGIILCSFPLEYEDLSAIIQRIDILRTKESHLKYKKLRDEGFLDNGCRMCKEDVVLKEFRYWKILTAKFPWDGIAETHHLIIPKRHVAYVELTEDEKKEYDLIKSEYIEKEYELIAEGTINKKTIPAHLHIHLIILKKVE